MKKDFFDKGIVDFKGLRIRLASPEEILQWSYGEVTKPETINYRTWRPEKDGLFCERIFGPTKDYECYCGKYKGIRFKGVICDKCGVEVTHSRVRRERMGHISLAVPVVHLWFLKNYPSPISLLLRISQKEIEAVVYFARYLVTSLDEGKRQKALDNFKEGVKAEIARQREVSRREIMSLRQRLQAEKKQLETKIKNKDQRKLAQIELTVNFNQKIQREKERFLLEKDHLKNLEGALAVRIRTLALFATLSEEEHYHLARFGAADFFTVRMGAEAILDALAAVDLKKTLKILRQEIIKTASLAKKNKIMQRIRVINGMLKANINPVWMILRVLPVIPPDLRPMVQLTGGRFATSDLNDLYRRVINRNNRLKKLIAVGAPEIILRNEKRMLQESVDMLIDATKSKGRLMRRRTPPRSLSDLLRGKKGRFRKNLLGKRVDYSGRSVIVVGPELRLSQCGLPKEIALEIFRPFILRELILRGLAPNIRSAKTLLDHRIAEVYDILEEVVRNRLILLNRAPTLHKLSIQAFKPILIDSLAIHLHPLVCSGFNADFDGDQMGVFLPLSKEAQREARRLILSSRNLLKPSDGAPVNVPSKEMVVGCYYATSVRQEDSTLWQAYQDKGEWPEVSYFMSLSEAETAYDLGKIGLRQLIIVKLDGKRQLTTVGRLMFNQLLPSGIGFLNQAMNSKRIKSILAHVFSTSARREYVRLVDAIKDFGFWGMTISGISLGVFDLGDLPGKREIIAAADRRVHELEETYQEGLLTAEEKERLSRDIWLETTDDIAAKTWQRLSPDSPIKLISGAGAKRVSQDQIKQVSGMRGLVVDPLGHIVPLPTKSSFRDGLSTFEYVTGARGSRKGLTDTALKTADAGYLTRKLIDVAHTCLVREEDCGTNHGITIRREGNRESKFYLRISDRVLAAAVKDKKGKIILKRGTLIGDEELKKIKKAGIKEVVVRSPLTCETEAGVCSKCYGADLSKHKLVKVGMPVGVIAAQSIGEPGTQLTLRTKHSGGVIGLDVTQGLPRVQELFEMRAPKAAAILADTDGKIDIRKAKDHLELVIKGSKGKEVSHRLPLSTPLLVKKGRQVAAGDQLTAGSIDIKRLALLKGIDMARRFFLNEVQKVYETQGISIHDKHFEVIIHEMSSRVRITEPGDTSFLIGSYVDGITFLEENKQVEKTGGKLAKGKKVMLGITQTSLHTSSWLSAASFQETTNVLTEAAILGREDKLIGLKENVIIGRLIPTDPKRARLNWNKEK